MRGATGDGPPGEESRAATVPPAVSRLTSFARSAPRYWLPPLALMAAIFWFSGRPDLPHAPAALLDFVLKKSMHAAAYAVLAVLWLRALAQAGVRSPARWAMLIAVVYAVTDEVHQTFVPGRSGRALDVAIDTLGAALGLAAAGARPRRWG